MSELNASRFPGLLPCPFCGSKASLQITPSEGRRSEARVFCDGTIDCPATGGQNYIGEKYEPAGGTKAAELAVKAWNTRVTEPATILAQLRSGADLQP